jgi:hypothetical protein
MRLTLQGREELGIEPAGDIASLRREAVHWTLCRCPQTGVVLKGVSGDALELAAERHPARVACRIERLRSPGRKRSRASSCTASGLPRRAVEPVWHHASAVVLDNAYARRCLMPARGCRAGAGVAGQKEPFRLRVFIDRSIVGSTSTGGVSGCRVYPGREDAWACRSGRGLGRGAESLDAWQLRSIYP